MPILPKSKHDCTYIWSRNIQNPGQWNNVINIVQMLVLHNESEQNIYKDERNEQNVPYKSKKWPVQNAAP